MLKNSNIASIFTTKSYKFNVQEQILLIHYLFQQKPVIKSNYLIIEQILPLSKKKPTTTKPNQD